MTAGENYYRGGLLDFNLNKKPAYDVLCDLFHHEWTTDVTLETDAEGKAKLFGFYGDYDLAIGDKKETFRLDSHYVSRKDIVL